MLEQIVVKEIKGFDLDKNEKFGYCCTVQGKNIALGSSGRETLETEISAMILKMKKQNYLSQNFEYEICL